MPRSGHYPPANVSSPKWRPYDIRSRSRRRAPTPQTSDQPDQTPLFCIPTSSGHHPSEIPQQPAAVADPVSGLTPNCAPPQVHHAAVAATVPGSILVADATMFAGKFVPPNADYDVEMDHIVRQVVDRIPIPDHPGCQALRDLVIGTIHGSLVSYRTQIAIFTMLLLGELQEVVVILLLGKLIQSSQEPLQVASVERYKRVVWQ
ncbi:hypothetical protein BKA83DRAFT_4485764 [Pisolithus microcarpus]|nr:hypothetical protein BKA83DRAFT_17426 [Pisolithus microcarpus]KAI6036750.1 hypothetical protein BKA83DRAFT_4485764 [Pisolithus microcarpus]